ncbi:cytokine receptor common subunit gamma isoform 3-T3 [Morphnus guianensis]
MVGAQHCRQAAPQLHWEELGLFGSHRGRLMGVECVLFNEEYMTCMWGSRETLTANYSLYYWYENRSPVVECKHYLQDRGVSVGCHFNQSEIIQFQPFHVLVNASLGGRTLEIPSKRMELQDLVKPEAPVNLTIRNMSNNQLQLTWTSPYPKAQCLEHAIKYKSNKDTSWTEHQVKGDVFSFPSVDYEKYYTFYVRSKINSYCGTTQLWSEWSVPVVWGSNSTSKGRSWGLWRDGMGWGMVGLSRQGMAKQVENWPKAAAVGVRPVRVPGAQAAALAPVFFALLEDKDPVPVGPANICWGFLALEGCSGMASPGRGHQSVVVTAWQGLGMGPFSILRSQLSPATDDAKLPWPPTKGHQCAHPTVVVVRWLGIHVTLDLSMHSRGAAALVLDPHGLDPHCLLPALAGPCHPAGAHGKVSGGGLVGGSSAGAFPI